MKTQEHDSNISQKEQVNKIAVRRSIFNSKYKWSLRKYWIGWAKQLFDINVGIPCRQQVSPPQKNAEAGRIADQGEKV